VRVSGGFFLAPKKITRATCDSRTDRKPLFFLKVFF